jgi:hypothetical protein
MQVKISEEPLYHALHAVENEEKTTKKIQTKCWNKSTEKCFDKAYQYIVSAVLIVALLCLCYMVVASEPNRALWLAEKEQAWEDAIQDAKDTALDLEAFGCYASPLPETDSCATIRRALDIEIVTLISKRRMEMFGLNSNPPTYLRYSMGY